MVLMLVMGLMPLIDVPSIDTQVLASSTKSVAQIEQMSGEISHSIQSGIMQAVNCENEGCRLMKDIVRVSNIKENFICRINTVGNINFGFI